MREIRRSIRSTGVALLMAAVLTMSVASAAIASPGRGDYNDEYIFAMTRSLNDMDMNPALKVTLLPVTIVLDTIFLPFAAIAGLITEPQPERR